LQDLKDLKDNVQTILVVEDEEDILELVEYNLKKASFNVLQASNGADGLNILASNSVDLVLLDIMMPGLDGMQTLDRIRNSENSFRSVPVMMLTAKGEELDVVQGLERGADDYLSKPFSTAELVSRIRAILRRVSLERNAEQRQKIVIKVGSVTINEDSHTVKSGSGPVSLTLAEFNLLKTLMVRPGRVFTRDQLLEVVSGPNVAVVDRNIDVHVRALRKKLDDDGSFIQTVRGVGYKCQDV
jgi:DNA-binding response OmpR family regulator